MIKSDVNDWFMIRRVIMRRITLRQGEVLRFITEYIDRHSKSPVAREISEYFAITIKGAQNHVAALRRKGYISLSPRRWRSIRLRQRERNNG
jgi:repressor LexA